MFQFNQLVSVNFQGVVVVFGRVASGQSSDIYFNVLGLDVEVDDDSMDWIGFTKVEFPDQVRQVGMGLITVGADASTMVPSTAPFRVVTDQKYISIVQQSELGTLYINRFRLLSERSGTDQKTKSYSLNPAWEVRYSRSHKEDVPADPSDTQDYLDPDGVPFLEPALELSMVDAVKDGQFDVVLLPVSGSESFAWQFLTLDAAKTGVHLFNFPASENGLFDVTGKPVDAAYQIQPDSTFSVLPKAGGDPLALAHAPRAAVYVKHEKVVQPDGSSIGVKRASRVMITLPVTVGEGVQTATIDTAVGTQGVMADLSGDIVTTDLVPAEFDLMFNGVSYLSLTPADASDNPLAIAGPYSMELMMAPASLGDQLVVIGGDPTAAPETAAPYLRIVDGDKIEVGFGDGTTAVSARTMHSVLISGTWSQVSVTYTGKGKNPFVISVNGSIVPLTGAEATAEPSGTPISQIGASSSGFVGALNAIQVLSGETVVLDLPSNSVDYSVTPPTTPNTASSGVVATVFGPKPEPSSSPVDSNMSGAFYIDDMGLTYYAGLADFIVPQADSCLIEGSDALLHLYYQGADDLLSVAQFSTASARATFYSDWTTDWSANARKTAFSRDEFAQATYRGWSSTDWTPVSRRVLSAPDKTQAGFLNFVAHRIGTYMNASTIEVRSSKVSDLLCDVVVTAPDGVGVETWSGLPRDIDQLSRIWNGAGGDNPDDPDIQVGKRPYFDYSASRPSVLVPSTTSNSGGYFLFTSVPFMPLNLGEVTAAQGATDKYVSLTLASSTPTNWDAGQVITQIWPDVSSKARNVLDTLTGKSTIYDYDTVQTPGTRAYGVPVSTARSDDQVSHVVIFVQDALKDFAITVSDAKSPHYCDVEVAGTSLPNVPRAQISFAEVLNGLSETYDYPDGYTDGIAKRIYAQTDGLSADVVNTDKAVPGGAFAYASLIRTMYLGEEADTARLGTQAKTAAANIQGAVYEFGGQSHDIAASTLFGAVIVDPPSDGGVGRLIDTDSYSDGKAPVLAPGVNGGWMRVAPRFSLGVNTKGSNYVSVDVDKAFSPSEQMAISSDLTVEGWLNHIQARGDTSSRALTYNVTGNLENPDLPLRYMIGAKRGPGLDMAASTYVVSSYNFDGPDLTLQVYVRPNDTSANGTIATISAVRGGSEFLSLSMTEMGKVELSFLEGASTLSSENALPTKKWSCVTLTVKGVADKKADLALYVDTAAPVTAQADNSFSDPLGALVLGSQINEGITKTTLNGVAFWQRALSADEVQRTVVTGFPDNDTLLGIRWNLAEGQGTDIMNSAATGADFNAKLINPASPAWNVDGAFDVPYAGRNDLVLASNRILKGWSHVALASRQGAALELDGENSGKVTDGSAFNPASSFAIEAWIAPETLNSKQVIVEKPGSYTLSVNTIGQVVLTVNISQDPEYYQDPPIEFTYEVSGNLTAGKTAYVAVNFSTGTVDKKPEDGRVMSSYFIKSALFIDGVLIKEANKEDYETPVKAQTADSSFYAGISGDETFNFVGLLSHVRVWSRTLNTEEIARVYAFRGLPADQSNLVAAWNFDEMSGKAAKDVTENQTMELTSNQLWSIWQDVSEADLYVNGRSSLPVRMVPADVGDYGDTQMTFGCNRKGGVVDLPFRGQIDDIRLFSTLLTNQQIRESMNKPLTGTEDHLASYWMIDAGSGDVVYDMTGRGNNGSLMPATTPPSWEPSSAPIQNEGQYVVNALGGQPDYYSEAIEGQPSVIEYAAAEKDAYGNIFSVMKRGYFFRTDAGNTVLGVGFKVGDLDTIFVGQVQSKPSIVGYIEGGPPIPSENQTLAYWSGDQGGPARLYSSVSTITYVESETKTWSFSANQSSTFNGAFNIKGGLYQKSKGGTSAGVGAEVEAEIVTTEIQGGPKLTISGDIGTTDSVAQTHSNSTNLTSSLTPAGTWEPEDNILNPVVGRRYIQNNVGIAIVKSATADLFMMALKGTQTPVGYTVVPNDQIPVDTNIIDFPINPKYVKNGTLDGKVGLVNDPDYPNANSERGSYFKPVEAYALKRSIEKEEQQIKAYYDQFSVKKYRVIGSLGRVKDKLKENDAYDFGNSRNQRSLYNTYVWTAVGGQSKEELSVANSYSETYTGASSLKFGIGAEIAAKVGTPAGGYYIEADAMLGNTWTMTATKSEATSNGFQLLANVLPTDFLAAPKLGKSSSGQLLFEGYETTAAPGKVDAYRYMSFLLAPKAENFTALNQVVDANWLNNSTTASANAMREALNDPTEPWRILYRTTYVSRVPAPFQPVKDDTNAPNITPPANLPSNVWLVAIIDDQITSDRPTPLEIGAAIDTVLGDPRGGPGLLKTLIPWWAAFYESAQVYGTEDFIELAELRIDLLDYMVSKYEAEAYADS
ncbi:LamG-like jellyroll fold domain-containing protein [Tateyamaria sp. SN3-11]|uniref:LamG domain-containing protein n=1 Tax=Tateyamaria sp. SN3-11 TaxID=3092147 RepID=UPI0039ECE90A